jgi:hypothetical protein
MCQKGRKYFLANYDKDAVLKWNFDQGVRISANGNKGLCTRFLKSQLQPF